jgi:hypothetical protein
MQVLAGERSRLQQVVAEHAAAAEAASSRAKEEVAAMRAQHEAAAAALAARTEALEAREAALKSAELEVTLNSRSAAHEEGMARDRFQQQREALVRGCGSGFGLQAPWRGAYQLIGQLV